MPAKSEGIEIISSFSFSRINIHVLLRNRKTGTYWLNKIIRKPPNRLALLWSIIVTLFFHIKKYLVYHTPYQTVKTSVKHEPVNQGLIISLYRDNDINQTLHN